MTRRNGGDTVTVTYEVVERDEAVLKTFARATCIQRGDVWQQAPGNVVCLY